MANYQDKQGLGFLIRASNAFDTAENAAAAAAVYGEYYVTKPCSISEFKFIVTTVCLAGTTAPVVEVNRRPTPGSATGEVLLAQITIPTGTAAGKVMSKRFAPVQLNVGDSLSFEHVTQAADPGTPTCSGFYDVVLEQDFESDGNQSDLVASA
jgi:hypothetical protein